MIDIFVSATRNVAKKRFRSFLTLLGISIGVTSVVLIGGISQYGVNTVNTELNSLGLGGLAISAVPNSQAELNAEDLELVKNCSQVEQAAPIVLQNTSILVRNIQTKALMWGIDSAASQIVSIKVLYGRMFSSQDLNTYANVCLVDETFAKTTYSRSNIIGKHISISCGGTEEEFRVIGIVKTGSGLLQNMMGNYIPTFVYVPYTTIQAFNGCMNFNQIAVKVKSNSDVEQIGKTIIADLNRHSGITNGFVANSLAKQKDGLTSILNIITLILTAIGVISLLIASLSIMTVMLTSVNERTHEIGIKKAIGAKKRTIMLEFLLEALILSIVGCFGGIAAGYLISFNVNIATGIFMQPRMNDLCIAICFSLISGLVFGVYPAYKAACLKPVEALRME